MNYGKPICMVKGCMKNAENKDDYDLVCEEHKLHYDVILLPHLVTKYE